MSKPKLKLCQATAGGETLVATLSLGKNGVAVLKPGDGDFERLKASIGQGVWSMKERRLITPAEGMDYIDAVERMHSRYSGWATYREGY